MATYNISGNKSLSSNEQFHRNNSEDTIHKICLKNGILTSILLIMCFLSFCGLTNRLEIHQLSVINMFLLGFGAYFAIQNISPTGKGGSVEYFEGLKVGMYSSCISVVIHALFLLVYTSYFPSILTAMDSTMEPSPIILATATLFEGLTAAFIITFCLMQYFKNEEQ